MTTENIYSNRNLAEIAELIRKKTIAESSGSANPTELRAPLLVYLKKQEESVRHDFESVEDLEDRYGRSDMESRLITLNRIVDKINKGQNLNARDQYECNDVKATIDGLTQYLNWLMKMERGEVDPLDQVIDALLETFPEQDRRHLGTSTPLSRIWRQAIYDLNDTAALFTAYLEKIKEYDVRRGES